jgi:hypothetical protein
MLDRLNAFNAKVRRSAALAAPRPRFCRSLVALAAPRRPPGLRSHARARRPCSSPLRCAPQFALPGLLYRNIATTNLYDADWRIVGASITFKARRPCGVCVGRTHTRVADTARSQLACVSADQARLASPRPPFYARFSSSRRWRSSSMPTRRAPNTARRRPRHAGATPFARHTHARPNAPHATLHATRRPRHGARAGVSQRAHVPQLRRHRRARA